MNILITRDSVSAGDDGNAPHSRLLSIGDDCSVHQVLESIREAGLPIIGGGNATWVAWSGKPLGVLAQQWRQSKPTWKMSYGTISSRAQEFDWSDGALRVHLNYLTQMDPDMVFSVVQDLTLRP
jgi:hypothetical protein